MSQPSQSSKTTLNSIEVTITDHEMPDKEDLRSQTRYVLSKLQAAGIPVAGTNFQVKSGVLSQFAEANLRGTVFRWEPNKIKE